MGVLCALLGFLGASGHLGVGGLVSAGGPVSGASSAVACASVSFAASGAFTAASASCAACAAVVAGCSCASAAARAVRAPAGTSFRVVTVKELAALASHSWLATMEGVSLPSIAPSPPGAEMRLSSRSGAGTVQ